MKYDPDDQPTKEQVKIMLILKYGSLEDAYWSHGTFVGVEHDVMIEHLRNRYTAGDTLTNLNSTVKTEI